MSRVGWIHNRHWKQTPPIVRVGHVPADGIIRTVDVLVDPLIQISRLTLLLATGEDRENISAHRYLFHLNYVNNFLFNGAVRRASPVTAVTGSPILYHCLLRCCRITGAGRRKKAFIGIAYATTTPVAGSRPLDVVGISDDKPKIRRRIIGTHGGVWRETLGEGGNGNLPGGSAGNHVLRHLGNHYRDEVQTQGHGSGDARVYIPGGRIGTAGPRAGRTRRKCDRRITHLGAVEVPGIG